VTFCWRHTFFDITWQSAVFPTSRRT